MNPFVFSAFESVHKWMGRRTLRDPVFVGEVELARAMTERVFEIVDARPAARPAAG